MQPNKFDFVISFKTLEEEKRRGKSLLAAFITSPIANFLHLL